VTLDALNASAANPAEGIRGPFRFYVRPVTVRAAATQASHERPTPPPPSSGLDAPVDPPMAWKLTAVVQRDRTSWAVFSDCRGIPATVREGESLAGEWRVTRIGIESVTLRSLDDRSTTLPLVGCQAR
jgi:hypothetical protein